MPKKTKREKIIAQYRRKLQQIHETAPAIAERISPVQGSQQISPTSPFVFQATAHTAQQVTAGIQPMDRAIRAGLIKTLILASMAIGAEVGLSVLMRK